MCWKVGEAVNGWFKRWLALTATQRHRTATVRSVYVYHGSNIVEAENDSCLLWTLMCAETCRNRGG